MWLLCWWKLSFSREKGVHVTAVYRKCIFHFIFSTPIFSQYDEGPEDGIKLSAAINTRTEEYIITHSFASPWTLRKQNLIWQYVQLCLSKVLSLDNFDWDFYHVCWSGKQWCLLLAEQRVIWCYCEQSLCCTEDCLNRRLLTLIQIK